MSEMSIIDSYCPRYADSFYFSIYILLHSNQYPYTPYITMYLRHKTYKKKGRRRYLYTTFHSIRFLERRKTQVRVWGNSIFFSRSDSTRILRFSVKQKKNSFNFKRIIFNDYVLGSGTGELKSRTRVYLPNAWDDDVVFVFFSN